METNRARTEKKKTSGMKMRKKSKPMELARRNVDEKIKGTKQV